MVRLTWEQALERWDLGKDPSGGGELGYTLDIREFCFNCKEPIHADDYKNMRYGWDDERNLYCLGCYEHLQGKMETDQ